MTSPALDKGLVRGLGLTAAIAVNVANIIGTGVFLKARVMTCNVGTPGIALTVWLVAGLLSLAGALTYAELLAMFPRAAGEYGIMRDAYGRPWGFIYGWTQFAIARSASAAALAVGFAIFLNALLKGALNQTFFTLPYLNVPFGRLQRHCSPRMYRMSVSSRNGGRCGRTSSGRTGVRPRAPSTGSPRCPWG